MSCNSTHGNKGAINLAARATGMPREDAERAFHDLKKEARETDERTVPAPTVRDWEDHLHQQRQLAGILLEHDARSRELVGSHIDAGYSEAPPDRESFYAQRNLVAEVRRRQIQAERAASGTTGVTHEEINEHLWMREQAEGMGLDPDQGGRADLMTDDEMAQEFADPIGSGRYYACGCRAGTCSYPYGGDCSKMYADDEYDPSWEADQPVQAAAPAERMATFLRAHDDENDATPLATVRGEHGLMSDGTGRYLLTMADLRTGDQAQLARFVKAHADEDDATPLATVRGEHGLMSDNDGPMLTMRDVRDASAHADALSEGNPNDSSWTPETMDEMDRTLAREADHPVETARMNADGQDFANWVEAQHDRAVDGNLRATGVPVTAAPVRERITDARDNGDLSPMQAAGLLADTAATQQYLTDAHERGEITDGDLVALSGDLAAGRPAVPVRQPVPAAPGPWDIDPPF